MGTVITLPRGRAFTRDDLEAMPDDGHRYEIVDGSLVVTPAPGNRHQTAVLALAVNLHAACPGDLKVLLAPFDVVLSDDTIVQPDLVVGRRSDFTARDLARSPLLAVEVLSPSTRRVDLTLKRSRYEAAGCASYWVVDPSAPSLTVWELEDGRYVERGHAVGEEELTVEQPYALTISPSQLSD